MQLRKQSTTADSHTLFNGVERQLILLLFVASIVAVVDWRDISPNIAVGFKIEFVCVTGIECHLQLFSIMKDK